MKAKTKPELGFNIDNGRTAILPSAGQEIEAVKIQISTRIDAQKYKQLKMLALSKNTKVQELIEQAIENLLANNS